MNEQIRLFLSVTLCTAIWLGWQLYYGEPPPPPPPAVSAPVDAPRGAGEDGTAAPAARPAKPAAPSEPDKAAEVTPRYLGVSTGRYAATVVNGRAPGFAALYLRDYAVREAGPAGEAATARTLPHARRPEAVSGEAEQAEKLACGDLGRADCGETLAAGGLGPQSSLSVLVDGARVALDFAEPAPGQAVDQVVLLGQSTDGAKVRLTLVPSPNDYVWTFRWAVDNGAGRAVDVQWEHVLAVRPSLLDLGTETPFSALFGNRSERIDKPQAIWRTHGSITRQEAKKVTGRAINGDGLDFAGVELQYFLLAALPPPGEPTTVQAATGSDDAIIVTNLGPEVRLAAGQSKTGELQIYLGPKREPELVAVAQSLQSVVDYNLWFVPLGFLARPMMACLRLFHDWTHSWGLAIVLLTVAVKSLLLPANFKSAVSMRRMQRLKPELEAIKLRHGNDLQASQAATMALYRQHQVNPVSGCLPLLLQIPVWLTLYRSLASAVDLYLQPFLWLPDLTAKEPFPLLALLTGLFTVLQQRITPMAADNQQAKVLMWVMPILVTAFMFNMPAGLVLYILVNSILTVAQQVVINRRAL